MQAAKLTITLTLAILAPISVWAGDQVGTLTQVQGTVKIFSHPSKTLHAKESPDGTTARSPHVLYEGEYFQVTDAKPGDHVDHGNILRTAPGSKARVVYNNGDQINVGSATAYRVSWNEDTAKARTEMDLAYGKLRGIIAKGGPRSKLQVRTKTAIMGVRGTDFFIAQGGDDQATEVSIMRGAVTLAPKPVEKPIELSKSDKGKTTPKSPEPPAPPKSIEVAAGFSAEVGARPVAPPPPTNGKEPAPQPLKIEPKVELRQTTKEEFAGITKSSTIVATAVAQTEEQKKTAPPPTKEMEKIIELEKKATVTTLTDIKTHDAKLYATLIEKGPEATANIDVINQAAMQTLVKVAPSAPKIHKPYKSELDDLENGAYDQYFKTFD